jgi:DNA-binding GntR family transcriptional regulator
MMAAAASTSDDVRPPASERAYRALKQLILDNQLGPGSLLLELEAAERLGMSRTPVREAMIRLEQEGLVAIRPRHGMRVLPLSPDDMLEIYEVLTGLEAMAAALAARRGAKPATLRAMRQAVEDMDRALARDDLKGWAMADERFHALLVEASGNRRLIAMAEQLWDQAHRARMSTLALRPKPTESNRDHAMLVDAIEKGDPGRAADIHHRHREQAGAMLVALLKRLGLNQL